MHKKSFTFGLGLSLIIISIVFYIVNFFENRELEASIRQEQSFAENLSTPEPSIVNPSDDDIIKRASELGMVFIDLEEIASLEEKIVESEKEEEPENVVEDEEVEETEPDEPVVEEEPEEPIEDEETEIEEPDEIEIEINEEPEVVEEVVPEVVGYSEFVKIRIGGGMSAVSIAKLLARHNVVSNADDFTNFLVRERVTTILNAGEFVFPLNAEYKDILNVLRKKVRY